MVVLTNSHLLTYKKRSNSKTTASTSSGKWSKSKTILLSKFYRYQYLNAGQKDMNETISLRTRQGVSMTFCGIECMHLHQAIQRVTNMVQQHPNNVYRSEKYNSKNNKQEEEEKKLNKEKDEKKRKSLGEDMGTVSDSYLSGLFSEHEDNDDDDDNSLFTGSGLSTSNTMFTTTTLQPSEERHIVDVYGSLAATMRLKDIGEVIFCGLVLQDKGGQGWKQRRVVVLTTFKLLTFKLKTSARSVKLSKNILLENISSFKKKEKEKKIVLQGNEKEKEKKGEGIIIISKKKTFDFEGEGCHALFKSLQVLIGEK